MKLTIDVEELDNKSVYSAEGYTDMGDWVVHQITTKSDVRIHLAYKCSCFASRKMNPKTEKFFWYWNPRKFPSEFHAQISRCPHIDEMPDSLDFMLKLRMSGL